MDNGVVMNITTEMGSDFVKLELSNDEVVFCPKNLFNAYLKTYKEDYLKKKYIIRLHDELKDYFSILSYEASSLSEKAIVEKIRKDMYNIIDNEVFDV